VSIIFFVSALLLPYHTAKAIMPGFNSALIIFFANDGIRSRTIGSLDGGRQVTPRFLAGYLIDTPVAFIYYFNSWRNLPLSNFTKEGI
jgi:hypothetical protein